MQDVCSEIIEYDTLIKCGYFDKSKQNTIFSKFTRKFAALFRASEREKFQVLINNSF